MKDYSIVKIEGESVGGEEFWGNPTAYVKVA